MSNDPKPNGNGIAGLLTTLASSGDNWVKLIIVGGLFVNTIWTKNNGTGIKEADRQLDILRVTVSRQIKSIYDNQNFLFDFVDSVRMSQDKIQTKLDIPHESATPYPRQTLPDYLGPYPYPQHP